MGLFSFRKKQESPLPQTLQNDPFATDANSSTPADPFNVPPQPLQRSSAPPVFTPPAEQPLQPPQRPQVPPPQPMMPTPAVPEPAPMAREAPQSIPPQQSVPVTVTPSSQTDPFASLVTTDPEQELDAAQPQQEVAEAEQAPDFAHEQAPTVEESPPLEEQPAVEETPPIDDSDAYPFAEEQQGVAEPSDKGDESEPWVHERADQFQMPEMQDNSVAEEAPAKEFDREVRPVEDKVSFTSSFIARDVFVDKNEYQEALLRMAEIEQLVHKASDHLVRVVDDEAIVSAKIQEWHDLLNNVQENLIAIDMRLFDKGDAHG